MSLGPKTITPDRVDYMQEISESWKKQMLLNIVKLRYFDPPTFLDVSSIINQYGIENQVSTEGRWYWPVPSTSGYYAGLGGYTRYSDKPTITYTPLSGQKFTKNLLTPIPPAAVVSLIQGGWPIDVVFSFAVKTINGVSNGSIGRVAGQQDDFNRLVTAMRVVQMAGISDIRIAKVNDQETVVFVISDTMKQDMFPKEREEIRSILKIKPGVSTYKITYGSLSTNDEEIALLTRSMLEIMFEMAATVEVPQTHVRQNRVKETAPLSDNAWQTRIHSGKDKPRDAYAAIRYQGSWFWVANNDISSKRNFALLMVFMSLTESDQKSGAGPLLSIGG